MASPLKSAKGRDTPLRYLAKTTTLSGFGLAFLQRRVGLFGLVAGGLVLVFYSLGVIGGLSGAALVRPDMLTHAGAGVSLLAMWAAARGATRSARWVRGVETAGLVAASTLFVMMGMYLPVQAHPRAESS